MPRGSNILPSGINGAAVRSSKYSVQREKIPRCDNVRDIPRSYDDSIVIIV